MRADPVHAPEILALAAAERHGPAAAAWAEKERGTPAHKLVRQTKRHHARLARVSGAATGVGGMVTMVPDMAAAIWIQSRCVFFVAAAHGFDPTDRMRPAELLVLLELYDDPAVAREALDGAGRSLAAAAVSKAMGGREDESLASRLAQMLLRRGAARLGGRAVPGIAVVANAVGNERAVRELADRADAFYGG